MRRLLIDYKFLERTPNGAKYWVVKKEDEKEAQIETQQNFTRNQRYAGTRRISIPEPIPSGSSVPNINTWLKKYPECL